MAWFRSESTLNRQVSRLENVRSYWLSFEDGLLKDPRWKNLAHIWTTLIAARLFRVQQPPTKVCHPAKRPRFLPVCQVV